MKKFVQVILALSLMTSCAKIKGDVDVKTQPIQVVVPPIEVRHYIALDTDKLEAYYRIECSKTYTVQADIDSCTQDLLNKFISDFTKTQ